MKQAIVEDSVEEVEPSLSAPQSSPPDQLKSVEYRQVIHPVSNWELPDFEEFWRNRHLLSVLVKRNVKYRYRQSFFGPLWFVLDPLMKMGVLSILLGGIARLPSEGVPYPLFIYSALLPWTLFSSSVGRSTECLVRYMHIISKVYFPRILLPLAEVITALVDFALSFGVLLVMAMAFGFFPTWRLLVLPVFTVLVMALALGVGLLFAGIHARFRDMSKFLAYVLQFWMYGTPVAYSASLVEERLPRWFQEFYLLNPMNGIVEGFRWMVIDRGRPPDWTLLTSCLVIILILIFGAAVFRKTEHSVIDLV